MKQEVNLLTVEKQESKQANEQMQQKVEELQYDLQQVNFEKNRLKNTITNDKEFANLRQMVDRIQQMVIMKQPMDFTEGEKVLFN